MNAEFPLQKERVSSPLNAGQVSTHDNFSYRLFFFFHENAESYDKHIKK